MYAGVGTSPAAFSFETDDTDPSLVTKVYVREQGYGVGDFATLFAASGKLIITETANYAGFVTPYGQYTIDAAASAGGITTLDVTHVSSSGTFTATNICTFLLFGAAAGSGSGDVVGPSSVQSDSIAVYDGTTGKLIKAATDIYATGGHITLDSATADLRIRERNLSPSAVANYGYYWVRDDAPNTPMFTGDTGVRTQAQQESVRSSGLQW